MRKISAIVLTLIFAFVFSVSSFADSFNIKIDDAASLFTEEEIGYIDENASDFASESGFSVAVVTTDDATGKSAMEYADDYYDGLIFDSGWSENGMLFLIDMDNREIYVSCAGLCIDEYSDSELNTIIDKGYDCVVNEEYAKCILVMIDEARYLASGGYYSDESVITDSFITGDNIYDDYYYDNDYSYGNDYYEAPEPETFKVSHVFVYIVIGLAAGLITVLVIKNNYKNTGKGDEFNANDISLELTASNDNIISRNVITTKIPRNNNHNRPGGGGGGGKVSVHRSSGGVRHSGAGRKF